MTAPKLFIVTGISGSGKTTIARQLIKNGEVAFDSKLNLGLYEFIDSEGNVAESVKLSDEDWRNRYKWSLNGVKFDKLLRQYSNVSRVFLCGRANLFQYWDRADAVLLLEVDEDVLRERLNSESRDNLFAKDKVTQNRLLNDLDSVQYKIIEKGGIPIDATVSIDGVVEQILYQVELR
jgi:broad-specificity NMP kinase